MERLFTEHIGFAILKDEYTDPRLKMLWHNSNSYNVYF